MDKKENYLTDLNQLRSRAEKRQASIDKQNIAEMSADDISVLLHDLETHQIELEMQNEDLRRTQIELTNMRDQYAELYNFAPIGYLTMNTKGIILQSNHTFSKMLGIPKSQLISHRLSEFITDNDQDAYHIHMVRLQETQKEQECELRLRAQPGGSFWVSLKSVCVESPEGEFNDIRLMLSNINERKQLETQLNQAQRMEAVGQLTGGIAHDFNNILGIVLGNLEIIQRLPPGDSRIPGRLDIARKSIKRGAEITRKLLGFSRKDPHEVQSVDLNESVNNLFDLITKSLTVSIDVKTDLADDLWTVEIDPGDLEDTILNLALNARDAMPDGGKLTIETANKVLDEDFVSHNPAAAAGSFVLVSIRDTGTGMSDKVKDRVFEPFFTTKGVGKGTGLGLSMVYGFVERSGGFIIIGSEIGSGTAFHLYFPRAIKNEADLNEPEITTNKLPRGHEKILIVDDEEGLRDIAAFNLEELGYTTFTAEDGPEALKILEQERDIDLLFSDIVMPNKMDGYELAQRAHKLFPNLKTMLASGRASNRSTNVKSDDDFLIGKSKILLNKPYNISEMMLAVRTALDEEL